MKLLTHLLEHGVLLPDIFEGRFGCRVGFGIDGRCGGVARGIELGVYRLEVLERVVGGCFNCIGLGGGGGQQAAWLQRASPGACAGEGARGGPEGVS